jgi:Bax protein
MKQRRAVSTFSVLLPTALIFISTLAGCGKGFQATSLNLQIRPPATADPLSAEDQRRLEATQKAEDITPPALDTEVERGALLDDLTEEKPKYTEDQLAEDAQRAFDLHRSKKRPLPSAQPADQVEADAKNDELPLKTTPPSAAPHDAPATPAASSAPAASAPAPSKTASSAPAAPSTAPAAPTAAAPNTPGSAAPAPAPAPAPGTANTGSGSAPAPTTATAPAPNAPATTAPAKPATASAAAVRPPRARRPSPVLHSEFCDRLNVSSATGKTDLTPLYNSNSQLSASMPTATLSSATSDDKKNRFVCELLPSAIRMNEEVFKQRVEVLRLQAKQKKGVAFSKEDLEWLTDMRTAYGVQDDTSFEALLKRVDIVPLPLLLAQAALESAWGTSRATVDLNNIFGLHARPGQPCKTGYDTRNACVRIFDSIPRSVSAYIELMNTDRNYPKFRDLRAKMRQAGDSLDSIKLLATLGSYNETPAQYIRSVREIMTGSNKLTQFSFEEEAVQLNK